MKALLRLTLVAAIVSGFSAGAEDFYAKNQNLIAAGSVLASGTGVLFAVDAFGYASLSTNAQKLRQTADELIEIQKQLDSPAIDAKEAADLEFRSELIVKDFLKVGIENPARVVRMKGVKGLRSRLEDAQGKFLTKGINRSVLGCGLIIGGVSVLLVMEKSISSEFIEGNELSPQQLREQLNHLEPSLTRQLIIGLADRNTMIEFQN
jgi:hypothetical protein